MSVVIADWPRGSAPYIPTNGVHDTLGARGCLLPAGTPMVPGGLARSQDRSREGSTLDGPIPAVAGSDKGPPLTAPSPQPPGYNLCTHKSPLSLPPGNRAGCLVRGGTSRRLHKGGRRRVLFRSFTHPLQQSFTEALDTELEEP